MTEKTRYSDEELAEFKELILKKLAVAREEYESIMGTLMNTDNNGVDDTSPTYKALEEGANTQTKEVKDTRRNFRCWPRANRSSSRGLRPPWCVSKTRPTGFAVRPAN